jgi:hypothetical protein
LPQTFETVFSQYVRHREYKSLAPDGSLCMAESAGLLKRYPVTAAGFHLIGKETERGWEQAEDISTLLPSLGERGRNRTFNLLILNQWPIINDFNRFPALPVGQDRQF